VKDSEIAHLLKGIIGLAEMVFPKRVRAYYLTGSYAEGTAVSRSDLVLIIFFKGAYQPEEANRLQQLSHYASQLIAMRLDLTPKYEDDLLANGATSLKLAGKLLRGTDILDQIPFGAIEQYRQDVYDGFLAYQRQIRHLIRKTPVFENLGLSRCNQA